MRNADVSADGRWRLGHPEWSAAGLKSPLPVASSAIASAITRHVILRPVSTNKATKMRPH